MHQIAKKPMRKPMISCLTYFMIIVSYVPRSMAIKYAFQWIYILLSKYIMEEAYHAKTSNMIYLIITISYVHGLTCISPCLSYHQYISDHNHFGLCNLQVSDNPNDHALLQPVTFSRSIYNYKIYCFLVCSQLRLIPLFVQGATL